MNSRFKIPLWFAILAIAMIVLYPDEGKFGYDYQIGRPWIYETLITQFDFPILKSEQEMLAEKEARALEVVNCYQFSDDIAGQSIARFREDFEPVVPGPLLSVVLKDFNTLYEAGIISEFNEQDISDLVILVKKNKRLIEVPAENVYTLESATNVILDDIRTLFPDQNIDSIGVAVTMNNYIAPNLIFDESMTNAIHKDAVGYISPTKGMIYSGQMIVSKGEILTADLCQVLDSYKAEYKLNFGQSGSSVELWIGHSAIIIAIVLMLFLSIFFTDKSALVDTRRLSFILLLALIVYLAVVCFYNLDQELLLAVPFAAIILYFNAFFKDSIVHVVYLIMLLPLLIFPERGVELFFMNVVAGQIALFSYGKFNRGWLQFLIVVFIFVAMLFVSVSFHLCDGKGLTFVSSSYEIFYLAVNAIFVIVLYPFTFLFEKAFGFVSFSRLRDLADTNTPLLQELRYKAPGTFQHSLQVANLAENAARVIGANDALVRVGALYHDIGKMENPAAFIENAAPGVNLHEGLSPEESANVIIKHVEDGLALAKKFKLPQEVIDFIDSHHGKTRTDFFYNSYCNAGGDAKNTEPFTYKGNLPVTKEQVVLMLADTVEAASRTLKVFNEESVSLLVNTILKAKLSSGQFLESDITFKELHSVIHSFKSYILQINHARIAYPKAKGKQ